MNALRLYVKNPQEKEVGWVCSNCNTVFRYQEPAENCCKPIICEKCGKEINRDKTKGYIEAYYINPTRCSSCYIQDKWNEMETLSEEEYLTLCKEDDSYGPVFVDSKGYEDLYEALEDIIGDYDNIEEVPDEFELGQWHKMDKLHIEDIIYDKVSNISGDNWEPNADEVYTDVQELFDFVKEWNAKQTQYKYYVGCNKKVRLNPETIKEYWGD